MTIAVPAGGPVLNETKTRCESAQWLRSSRPQSMQRASPPRFGAVEKRWKIATYFL
jgi:hypothetical protein